MQPPFPAPIKQWHNATYDAILPTRPELSAAGKNVIITGAGTGIGREMARTFATAGAASIHVVGRRLAPLEETKRILESEFPNTQVEVHSADVTDEAAMKKVAEEAGQWDVYVANAGYYPQDGPIATADAEEWWSGFEINVKGSFIATRALVPTRKANASIVSVSTGAITFPAAAFTGGSAYSASKLAMTKFYEYVAAEYPDLQVVTIHPGVILTDMGTKSGKADTLPQDDIKLPAHFTLWASSPEAAFANGKFIWSNWDVDEMKGLAKKFTEDQQLSTSGVVGWPFADFA